jgi:hypothetical protein
MNTSTMSGSSLPSDGSDSTTNLRQDASRLAHWQRQPCSEDPWSPGQNGKEKHKAMLAYLGDFMNKMDSQGTLAAAEPVPT